MALFEIPFTAIIDATDAAAATRARAEVEKLLTQPTLRLMLSTKGIRLAGSIVVGEPKAKK